MKLIPLSDFVEKYTPPVISDNQSSDVAKLLNNLKLISNYTKFLKQPLTLGMFVPVDKHGSVLESLQFCCSGSDCGCMGMPVNVSCQEEIDEYYEAQERVLFANAVTIDESPYKMTERLMIDLKHPASFRIYNKFTFNDGRVESQFLPNFSKNPTVEYLVDYGLELTPSALEAIGIKSRV
jgi:hypothetical protein